MGGRVCVCVCIRYWCICVCAFMCVCAGVGVCGWGGVWVWVCVGGGSHKAQGQGHESGVPRGYNEPMSQGLWANDCVWGGWQGGQHAEAVAAAMKWIKQCLCTCPAQCCFGRRAGGLAT